MTQDAYTWSGVLGHLAGIENNSGQNGLGTWYYAKPSVDAALVDISWRGRYYGQALTGVSTSVSASAPFASAGPLTGKAGVGVKLGGLQINASIKGEFDLLSVFRLGKSLAAKAEGFGPIVGVFDQILDQLPDISIVGEAAIYVGRSGGGIWFIRLQTGGGISFKLPQPIGVGHALQTNIRGANLATGRSWQIQLQNWSEHIPRQWN